MRIRPSDISAALAPAAFIAGLLVGRRRGDHARSSDLALANELSREVGGLMDLDEVYRTAVAGLHRRMPDEGVAILRCDPAGGRFLLVAGEGSLRIEPGWAQPLDAGLLGIAARTGRPVMTSDARRDPRCVVAAGMDRLRAEVVIPIRDRHGAVHAVLDVTSSRPRRFDAADVDLLATVANALEGSVTAASLYERLAQRAATDPLTGLPNHRAFQERLAMELAIARSGGRPLSLCLIDVDRFKDVNDAEGHQAGDRVLMRAAEILTVVAGPNGVLARVGGDEFGWILPGADGATARAAVERARVAVAAALDDLGATISAGVCDTEYAAEPEELFRLADGALYWAKAQGRDLCVRYSPDVVVALSGEERAAQAERARVLGGLRALARAVDAKDPSTRHHSERVAALAGRIARTLNWPDDAVARLREAALLHDVGKIGVPDAVLLKPGRLSDEEHAAIRQHSALGAQIAGEVLSAEQAAWIRHHHERFDGTGYPDLLAGEEIPMGARILATADAWDAMTSDRPYRAALSERDALAECLSASGGQLCPACVGALTRVIGVPAASIPPPPPDGRPAEIPDQAAQRRA